MLVECSIFFLFDCNSFGFFLLFMFIFIQIMFRKSSLEVQNVHSPLSLSMYEKQDVNIHYIVYFQYFVMFLINNRVA